jgi:hypothetical protein
MARAMTVDAKGSNTVDRRFESGASGWTIDINKDSIVLLQMVQFDSGRRIILGLRTRSVLPERRESISQFTGKNQFSQGVNIG